MPGDNDAGVRKLLNGLDDFGQHGEIVRLNVTASRGKMKPMRTDQHIVSLAIDFSFRTGKQGLNTGKFVGNGLILIVFGPAELMMESFPTSAQQSGLPPASVAPAASLPGGLQPPTPPVN